MESPLVSVILTSYNYEQYVAKSIESVLGQSYPNVELIVVDDGSEDGSQKIIKDALQGASIKNTICIFQDNAGQGAAFNAGFERASGKIIAFLDSDDYWFPDRLDRIVNFMRLVPDAAVYQHQLEVGAGVKRNSLMSADLFRLWMEWDNGVFNIADEGSDLLLAPFVPTSGLTFHKHVLERVFPVPEELLACPDAYLTRTSIVHGPLASLPLTLGVWRDHDGNAGKDKLGSTDFWISTIMPTLNSYYERNGIHFRFVCYPPTKSRASMSKMLGQIPTRSEDQQAAGLKHFYEEEERSAGHRTANLLRLFCSEQTVQRIRRFVRGMPHQP